MRVKRLERPRWIPQRWEAARRLGVNAYEVATGFTKRSALRNLANHRNQHERTHRK